ncbi:hypothetical protein Dsin_023441, partial [Dipteronia sinensis]
MAAAKSRRISYPRSDENQDQSIAKKGNFIVYTNDGKRFMVPLEYLSRNVFTGFLRMAGEEFGLPSHEANTLPCDSTMFEYVVSLVRRWMPEELEKALLTSIASCHQLASSSSSSLVQGQTHQQ